MITIVTPYDHGEVTAAAVRLGELGVALGLSIHLVADGPCRTPVHPYWDGHVNTAMGNGIYRAARNAETVVWFVASTHLRSRVDLVAPKARHIFVPTMLSLGRVDAEWLSTNHAEIVCPTRQMAGLVKERLYPSKNAPVTWANWFSGMDPVQRIGLVNHNYPKLLVFCDAPVVDHLDTVVLTAVGDLLKADAHVSVTIAALKSWETKGRRRIRQLTDRYGGRVQTHHLGAEHEMFPLFHQHDWGFFPNPRADFGMYLQHARACGLTVLAFDTHPFDELITKGKDGALLSTDATANWLGLPEAHPDAAILGHQLLSVVTDKARLESIQREEWNLVTKRVSFNAYWAKMLGCTDE